MLSRLFSSATIGIDAYLVEVEVDISGGLPAYIIVGLPDAAVKESRGRIEAAVKNSGIEFPFERITVNLAPADIKKEGSAFDLPIAVGILNACGIIDNNNLTDYIILGELSLNGKVKPIKGALSIASSVRNKKINGIILPEANAGEAAVIDKVNVYPVDSLSELIEFLNNRLAIQPKRVNYTGDAGNNDYETDFCDVKGQFHIKRALEVAASGGHNVIMIGPPGSGKSMLAKRLPSILPPLTIKERIETTKIHSIAGVLDENDYLVTSRPFRSPHHTISDAGLIGGGQYPMPGEVSLAHNGVLFLDELAEFKRNVLEVLRQPLEDGKVTIARASMSVSFPADFMFVSASNPCPCGYLNHPSRECSCTFSQIKRYMGKISGPLLDRIDIHIDVPPVKFKAISEDSSAEPSAAIRKRVIKAREIQLKRFKGKRVFSNSQMGPRQIKKYCALGSDSKKLLEQAVTAMGFSARAYDRILRLSRTIADLAAEENILPEHISEAIQYRTLDRETSF